MLGININYNKTDFLYYKYGYDVDGKELYNCNNNTINKGVLKDICERFPIDDGPCNNKFTTNLCLNKNRADKLLAQTMNHSGADELYKNTTSQFNIERMSFINLGIGIIASLAFIIKYN